MGTKVFLTIHDYLNLHLTNMFSYLSHRIGLVFSARKKSSDVKKGSNGRVIGPGVPAISKGPNGRVIRLSFLTGFPRKKSIEARSTKPGSDDLLIAKKVISSKEVLPEAGSTQADLNDFELDSKDTITKEEIKGTSTKTKSQLAADMKEDGNLVTKDIFSESLTTVQKSSKSITSLVSDEGAKK